jgi:hypothetical protein
MQAADLPESPLAAAAALSCGRSGWLRGWCMRVLRQVWPTKESVSTLSRYSACQLVCVCRSLIAAFRCAGVISFSKPFLASLKVVSPATGPLEQATLKPPIRVSDPATDISLNMSQLKPSKIVQAMSIVWADLTTPRAPTEADAISQLRSPWPAKQKGHQPGEANAPEEGLGLNKRPLSFTPSIRIAHLRIMSLRQSTNGKRPGVRSARPKATKEEAPARGEPGLRSSRRDGFLLLTMRPSGPKARHWSRRDKKGRQPGEANAPEQGLGLNKRPPKFPQTCGSHTSA